MDMTDVFEIQITLKSGVQITFHAREFHLETGRRAAWTNAGDHHPALVDIDVNEIAAATRRPLTPPAP